MMGGKFSDAYIRLVNVRRDGRTDADGRGYVGRSFPDHSLARSIG